ncbi:MAG: hypothetical protein ABR915_18000 [Thermoguttaceae bacterium]
MSEQSSVVVMFRALVMLVCLIAIPLAALFGSSLPAVVKAVQEGRWPGLAELRGSSGSRQNAGALSEAPRFIPNAATAPGSATPPAVFIQPPDADWPAKPLPAVPGVRGQDAQRSADARTSADTRVSAVVPARYDAPLEPAGETPRSSSGPKAGDSPSPGMAAPGDPLTLIQDRLRQLGATYYLLESWGDQERQYRFYCRMAIGGNPQHTQSFWSIEADPFKAMRQVLEQVEAWRSGRP